MDGPICDDRDVHLLQDALVDHRNPKVDRQQRDNVAAGETVPSCRERTRASYRSPGWDRIRVALLNHEKGEFRKFRSFDW